MHSAWTLRSGQLIIRLFPNFIKTAVQKVSRFLAKTRTTVCKVNQKETSTLFLILQGYQIYFFDWSLNCWNVLIKLFFWEKITIWKPFVTIIPYFYPFWKLLRSLMIAITETSQTLLKNVQRNIIIEIPLLMSFV